MQISEASGWRLQLDRNRRPYAALIGGEGWAVELSLGELAALQRGVHTLRAQLKQLLPCLMPEEELDLELEVSLAAASEDIPATGSLFLALSGTTNGWSLRFVLTPADGSRAAEGAWSTTTSAAFAAALEGLGEGVAGAD